MLAALIGLTSYVLPSTPFGAQQQLAAASSRSAASCVRCQETSVEITPPAMESKVGFDYVPLLTALQAAEFREADFITRDALIEIAGPEAVKRGYVYFTEVPKLPVEDVRAPLPTALLRTHALAIIRGRPCPPVCNARRLASTAHGRFSCLLPRPDVND